MKTKMTNLLVFVMLGIASLSAQVSTVESASKIAQRFKASSKMELAYTQYTATGKKPALYVFNRGNNEGIVIVSALEGNEKIIGYTDEGRFDLSTMPEGMSLLFQRYADEVEYGRNIRTINDVYTPTTASTRRNAPAKVDTTYKTVAPLLNSIMWGQSEPFYNQTPRDANGTHCMTGCIATAVAQIMRYYKYPEHGKGSNSYRCYTVPGMPTLSADFSQSNYDWDNMLPRYFGSYSLAQANAVAKLMSDVGIACNMNYRTSSSATWGSTMMEALIKYFDYDAGIFGIDPNFHGQEYFEDKMREELYAGRPVFMGGENANSAGHAFVCDGLDNKGYFHINWGWSGSLNGYYALSVLNPGETLGTEGEIYAGGFNVNIDAYLGIQPNKGNSPSKPEIGVGSIVMENKPRIARKDSAIFSLTEIQNISFTGWKGYCGLALSQNDSIISCISAFANEKLLTYGYSIEGNCDFVISKFDAAGTPIPNGNYQLVPVYSLDVNGDNFVKMAVMKYAYDYAIDMTLTSDSVFFAIPDNFEPTDLEVATKGGTATATWNGYAPYYYLMLYKGKKQVGQYLTDKNSYIIRNLTNGEYSLGVVAVASDKNTFLSEWVGAEFTLTSVDLETISEKPYSLVVNNREIRINAQSEMPMLLFDLLGRKVADDKGTDCTLIAPTAGQYILKIGNNTAKVIIK